MSKALVLNSGGCDSSTLVGMAVEKYGRGNVITASHTMVRNTTKN